MNASLDRHKIFVQREVKFLLNRVQIALDSYKDQYGIKPNYIILPRSSDFKLKKILGLKVLINSDMNEDKIIFGEER